MPVKLLAGQALAQKFLADLAALAALGLGAPAPEQSTVITSRSSPTARVPSDTDQLPSLAVVVDPLATVTGVPEALARMSVTVTETPAVWCSMLPLTTGEN